MAKGKKKAKVKDEAAKAEPVAKEKLTTKRYNAELKRLHVELVKVQETIEFNDRGVVASILSLTLSFDVEARFKWRLALRPLLDVTQDVCGAVVLDDRREAQAATADVLIGGREQAVVPVKEALAVRQFLDFFEAHVREPRRRR